ncbi:MAG: YfcE family phosphodiesterase [Sedimentibacter sp.]|nr:YfcE family phosphodiesterase [Sedimentibacter sp.]
MKILVMSDSHNVILNSQIELIRKEGVFDLLIHCGDKFNDAQRFAEELHIVNVLNVPGNCDFSLIGQNTTIIKEIEGKKFIITHGHIHNVKLNLNKLKDFAKKNKADIVVYGHTHKSQNEFIDNILYFNPGSTIFPKDGRASFGIIEITEETLYSKIVPLEN